MGSPTFPSYFGVISYNPYFLGLKAVIFHGFGVQGIMINFEVMPKLFVISISHSERKVFVQQAGNRVLVYDATDGDLVHSLKGHKDLAKGRGKPLCKTPFLAHITCISIYR